jgi:hypothetical protein
VVDRQSPPEARRAARRATNGLLAAGFRRGLLVALVVAQTVSAQVLDSIDVAPREVDAEITIRFSQKILYLRHGPQNETKDLRIFLRLVDSPVPESELMQETLRGPKIERVPSISVVYPELRNGMLVSFAQPTRHAVRPGGDGRSMVITVPLLPAVAAITTAPPPGKPAPATSPGVPPAAAAVVPVPGPPTIPSVKAAEANLAPSADASKPVSPELAKPSASLETPPTEYVPPVTMSPLEVETLAARYMKEARQAIAAENWPLATNRLNRVLGLPASEETEPAQALIGEVRERNGELFKARAEYELYLKLFPTGANAPRVKQRLAGLAREPATAQSPTPPPAKAAAPTGWTYFGSVSAYYYTGKSQIETLVPPPPGELTFNRETLSLTDQRSLITSINLNARRRDAASDTRIVVRDTYNRNSLDPERSYNRLYSAYVDHSDRKAGYYMRAGRQNPNGIGVLERFDGVQAGYDVVPRWRVNAVYGAAVEFGSPFDKRFYGGSVDLLPESGKPGISLYGIEQRLDDFANRRAVGSEVRFFDGRLSAYGTVDYDVLYRGINIALAQANYLDEAGNSYFVSYDHRRAPAYSLTNALLAAPGLLLQDMIAAQGIATVRAQARDLSAVSDLFSAGVTHPLSERWQVGVDYRLASISATQAVNAAIPLSVIGTCFGTVDPANDTCVITTPAQPGTGTSHALGLQVIGNGLLVRNATGVLSVNLIKAPTYYGQAVSLNYVLPLSEQWRFDSNIRYYTQDDDSGDTQSRLSPSLKVSYQWQSSLYLEAEVGQETSRSSGPTRDDHIRRDYVFGGVRWDFR